MDQACRKQISPDLNPAPKPTRSTAMYMLGYKRFIPRGIASGARSGIG